MARHGIEERRCRSGCWACRDRRVKCSEERPACRPCLRLGLTCSYEVRLIWACKQGAGNVKAQHRSVRKSSLGGGWSPVRHSRVEQWMFLNTTWNDFPTKRRRSSSSLSSSGYLNAGEERCISSAGSMSLQETPDQGSDVNNKLQETEDAVIPREFTCLMPSEHSLFEYFCRYISPRCTMGEANNPYLNIVAPIALSSASQSLWYILLGISANQLRVLGDRRFERDVWVYRARALSTVRRDVEHTFRSRTLPDRWEQLLASIMMLCFFDVAEDCSHSWVAHLRCARHLLSLVLRSNDVTPQQEQLCHFVLRYFRIHHILARTASASWNLGNEGRFGIMQNDQAIDPLWGGSNELLNLVNAITDLADETAQTPSPNRPDAGHGDISCRRDQIERRLYTLEQLPPKNHGGEHDSGETDKFAIVAETKRLAALIYFYVRLDGASPSHQAVSDLTSRILALLPRISLRTNTLLWPLFVVGTMGLQADSDEGRKVVLERLTALRETRHLGCVKKARQVIEEVWRSRDLGGGNAPDLVVDRGGWLSLA